MESNPFSNPPSSSDPRAEKIHSKEEILAVILPSIESPYAITDERRDEKGIYMLELTVEGESPGEKIVYNYTRAGRHEKNVAASVDYIEVTSYSADGEMLKWETFARFENGVWRTGLIDLAIPKTSSE